MRKTLALSLIAFACLRVDARAEEAVLTEQRAVQLALGRAELADWSLGVVELARGEQTEAGTLPNPELAYSREALNGHPDSVEQTLVLSQRFELSGRRALRTAAAERRVEAAASGVAARSVEAAAEARRRFHEVLYRQGLLAAVQAWGARFERAEDTLRKLHSGGEVSGYDLRRLSRERLGAQARIEARQAELDRAWERLAAVLGEDGARFRGVDGSLLPGPAPALDVLLESLHDRPDLQALQQRAAASDLERRAAERGWIPDITLGAGAKRLDDGFQTDSGLVVTVSLPLPMFDRNRAGAEKAAAQARVERSDRALALAEAAGEMRGLWKQLERLRSAAQAFRERSAAASVDIARIAEVAYAAGEADILELLDAWRGDLEAEITALEMEWSARQARIELDALAGEIPR